MAPRERYSARSLYHLEDFAWSNITTCFPAFEKYLHFFSLLCRCSLHFPHGFFQHGPYKVLFQRHVTMFAAVQHQTQISFECRPRLSDLSVSYKFSLSRVQFPHWFCSKGRVRVQRSDWPLGISKVFVDNPCHPFSYQIFDAQMEVTISNQERIWQIQQTMIWHVTKLKFNFHLSKHFFKKDQPLDIWISPIFSPSQLSPIPTVAPCHAPQPFPLASLQWRQPRCLAESFRATAPQSAGSKSLHVFVEVFVAGMASEGTFGTLIIYVNEWPVGRNTNVWFIINP